MGIAALVIGIIAVIVGFIPLCGIYALIPAIVGLILGIVDMVLKGKQQRPRGMAIAGMVLNLIAIVFILFWVLFFAAAVASDPNLAAEMNRAMQAQ